MHSTIFVNFFLFFLSVLIYHGSFNWILLNCYVENVSVVQGAGTDESDLVEILASRSNADIKAIKAAYETGES